MLLPLVFALFQAPAQAPSPIARVDVSPAAPVLEVGQTVQLTARALDANGKEVPGATIRWFGGGEGSVDSLGVVTAGFRGKVNVTAVASVPGARPTIQQFDIRVKPQGASRLAISPAISRLLPGTRLTLSATAYSADNDRVDEQATWSTSDPRIVKISPDGRLVAVAAGKATVTARAGKATATVPLQVLASGAGALSVSGAQTARTGDVVRFTASARGASGDFAVQWALAGGAGAATIDENGAFVAEQPGRYTVTASAGGQVADASVTVTQRKVMRPTTVLGRVPIAQHAAEVWVHPSGTCAYLTTIADKVYAIDVSQSTSPHIVDSMVVDARLVNDVMTTEDGKYGVFSREGNSQRKNGIVVFDASDPCHPRPIADYTETVAGGVHSSYVYRGHVYLTDDATGSMRVIDIGDPRHPKEVGRWQTEQSAAGRYVHDIMVVDGLAYLSYWNDGLIILDVGNGMKKGSPEKPVFVSQYKYDLDETYARIDQLYGLGSRGTHTAWRAGTYVFVGDEVYAAKETILGALPDLTWGRLHVLDVSDIEHPKEVAWYEPTDGGVHNVWVVGDTLYLGNYQGGARALDISGELKGDLLRQGREMSWIQTADTLGVKPKVPFTWGAVVKNGIIYVPDINSGLWVMKLEPKKEKFTP